MRNLYLLLLLIFSNYCIAQSSDYILLKKKSKTIKMFYKGSNIEFVSTTGAYRNGLITQIKNDSIFLQEFIINRIPTTLGFYVTDTAGSYRYAYNYNQISYFGRENKKFNVGGSGASLLGGGILITLASGVIYLVDRKIFSGPLMAAGAGLAVVGYLLNKASGKGITIGKKHYTLQYINMNASQK